MSERIDQNMPDAVDGNPLPAGHHAKKFADGLPGWHPVRRLFTGPSPWIARIDEVYCLLRLFSTVHEDRIKDAYGQGRVRAIDPIDSAVEIAALKRDIPNDVVYQGRAYKFSKLYAKARASIEAVTAEYPQMRRDALESFDRALAKLVRAVRSS